MRGGTGLPRAIMRTIQCKAGRTVPIAESRYTGACASPIGPYGNTSAPASSAPLLSLAETIGAPLIGQSIASAGSLHRIDLSCSGAQ